MSLLASSAALVLGAVTATPATTEFCLDGRFDLGVRHQGHGFGIPEHHPTRWCVVTETPGRRVLFSMTGRSNSDRVGRFTVAYDPAASAVRLVLDDGSPDLAFEGAITGEEAARHARIDPRRLLAELRERGLDGDGRHRLSIAGQRHRLTVKVEGERVLQIDTRADLPLRGAVPVVWAWRWDDPDAPGLTITVAGEPLFEAVGHWRDLPPAKAQALWRPTGDETPRVLPGGAWPARVAMSTEPLAPGVHRVLNVRTGFHHLVVETAEGLVIGDAPAGWVEMHQLPPADLVPGLGVSGLSERFVDYLRAQWPGRPIRAVVLTHGHDDHAGGARAFADAGAEIYAPAAIAAKLERAFGDPAMPRDRLGAAGGRVEIEPISGRHVLAESTPRIELLPMDGSPHVAHALAVWLPDSGHLFQSDIHGAYDQDGPPIDRLPSECWFAAWSEALPAEAVVLGTHGTEQTPLARVRRLGQSEACR